ncbi:MAG: FlgD immunoglobulin-like domain containing protein [bacterium]
MKRNSIAIIIIATFLHTHFIVQGQNLFYYPNENEQKEDAKRALDYFKALETTISARVIHFYNPAQIWSSKIINIELENFGTVSLSLKNRKQFSKNAFYWYGTDRTKRTSAFFSYHDGFVIGRILVDKSLFVIIHSKQGTQIIKQVNPSLFMKDADIGSVHNQRGMYYLQKQYSPAKTKSDPVVIDVMVLYSSNSPEYMGMGSDCLSTVIAALANNDIYDIELNLVYEDELPDSVFQESSSLATDVSTLMNNQTVQNMRDTYAADVVAYIASDADPFLAGIYNPSGYFASKGSYAIDYLTFAHEIAHIVGCGHNCDYTKYTPPDTTYTNQGYVEWDYNWSTIMCVTYEDSTIPPRDFLYSYPDLYDGPNKIYFNNIAEWDANAYTVSCFKSNHRNSYKSEQADVLQFTNSMYKDIIISNNYPNPFNPATTFSYQLPQDAFVTLEVFDMMGRKVTSLAQSQKSAGHHSVVWNAKDDAGRSVSSGTYLYRFIALPLNGEKSVISNGRMVLMR